MKAYLGKKKKIKGKERKGPGQENTLLSTPCFNGQVFLNENVKRKDPKSPGNVPPLSTPDYEWVLELGWERE